MPSPTNPYYTENFQGVPGQTARAEQVTTEFDGVQAGFDGVAADIATALKAPSGETMTSLPAAITRANMFLKFDSNGNPIVVNGPFNWRGLWQPSTTYFVGDIVQIAAHQNLVICNVQHTSGLTYVGTDWSVFLDLTGLMWVNYKQLFAGTYAAVAGDSLLADSTGGNVVINLPVAAVGDSPINVTYIGGSLAAGHTITINATGGQTIMGNTETQLALDVVNASMSLFYGGAGYGWRLRTMG